MCRTQFEHHDIAEAQLVCGTATNSDMDGRNGTINMSDDGEQDVNALLNQDRPPASTFTWRIPAWVTFSWTSIRHRPHHRVYRQPIPFRDQQWNTPSPGETRKAGYEPSINHAPRDNREDCPLPDFASYPGEEPGPVSHHPPPVAWDDQTTLDLPYDNPFYTRQVSNLLWLPRNPCGILDLDDTVDLKSSITVDLSIPSLGTWTGTTAQSQMSQTSVISTDEESGIGSLPLDAEVDGTEAIDLPPIIAQRAEDKGEAVDTAPPPKPSSFTRRVSGSSTSSPLRRPSTGRPAPVSYRSFSEGQRTLPLRQRSSSIMSIFSETPPLQRSLTIERSIGLRPDAQAQADFVAAHSSSSRLSLDRDRPRLKRSQPISAHHAIVREVVAEEESAFATRVNEEAAEAEKAVATRSWLTSWMYSRTNVPASSPLKQSAQQDS